MDKADHEVMELFYNLLYWSKGELKKAIEKRDWQVVEAVYRRIEDEIGYK